jgi:diguanylate cyclase (GGDEF)-like protein
MARLPLILPIVGLVLITSAAMVVVEEGAFRGQERHELRQRGASAIDQFTRGVDESRGVHATYARLLENTPGLATAVRRSQPDVLRRLLGPIGRDQTFQEITIYDRVGAEVVNVGAPVGDRIDASLFAAGLAGSTSSQAVVDPDGLVVLASTPIRQAGEVVGVLVVGSNLKGADLAQLEHQQGAQLAVFQDGVLATTTARDPALLRALGAARLRGGGAGGLTDRLEPFHLHPTVRRLGPDGALVALSSTADLSRFSSERKVVLVAAGALLLAVLALIAFFLTRTVLRPLEAMAGATRRMIDGDYSRRVATSRIPELDTLATGVNHLAERVEAQLRDLSHQAFHDAVTGLPNRALFLDRLDHALARARRTDSFVVVLFLDLDNFKVVNDSLGHEAADQLLVAVGERLRECVRAEDTLARLGGDEFTVLLEEVGNMSDALAAVARIETLFDRPFDVAGKEVFSSASIGLTSSRGGRTDSAAMIREADMAMYRAKANGKARVEVFDETMSEEMEERLALQTELRHAIPRGDLRVHYQPIVDLATGEQTDVEALVRWEHPERGLIPPLSFIPLAEESGLIVPLGQWVLTEACRQVKAWQDEHGIALGLSVNLSPRQFQHPGLVDDVAAVLADTGLEPESLRLEITENVVAEDVEDVRSIMQALSELGVKLVIDDFGVGYSSLVYLKRLPVRGLKIDRTFIADMDRSPEDLAIVEAMTTVARTLGLDVTAEGVESVDQLTRLRALGCERAQGYHFARPQPPADFEELLAKLPAPRLEAA